MRSKAESWRHMCIALMQFDFVTAFQANPVLLLLSPVLAVVGLQYLMHYILSSSRTGFA